MNVLVWNSWVTPAGGMERVALSIANGLAARGRRVVLMGPYQEVPLLRDRISGDIQFVECAFARRAGSIVANWRQLRDAVRKYEIDVVSAHGSLIPLLPLSVPVVWTEHGPRYGDEAILSGPRRAVWHLVQRRLRNGNWKLVGCSEYVRNHVCTRLEIDRRDAEVILNGVPDPGQLQRLDPPRFAAPYKLGLVGRLEPEKYPLDIFQIDKELVARGLECEWHVFGKGSLEPEMRHRAAGQPRVHIHGLAKTPAEAFAAVDALVFLSHGQREGLPTVILESRLARRPVIAWKVTANPEAAGPSDELVEPFRIPLFANAIARVLRRGEAPQPPGVGEFSFDQMIDRYASVLEAHILANRRTEKRHGAHAAGGAV